MENKVNNKWQCHFCPYYHENDPDYPDNCDFPDYPPCNYEQEKVKSIL